MRSIHTNVFLLYSCSFLSSYPAGSSIMYNADGKENAAAAAAADGIIIAIDCTGIKITNRGQWMQEKWQVRNKKGYLKIHIAVNIKTKEILAFLEVTDEKVYDGRKIMPTKLIEHILKRNNNDIKIESALGMDGPSYNSNENFKYLQKKRILACNKSKKEFYHHLAQKQ